MSSTKKIYKLSSVLIAGICTLLWMWKGYDISFKASVILLLWMIYNENTEPIYGISKKDKK